MLATVNKLIDSPISAAEIQRQTGVVDSTIKKVRLGTLDVSRIKYYNLKKLYDYQVYLDEENIKENTLNEFQQYFNNLEQTQMDHDKCQELFDINSKIAVRIREIVSDSIDDPSKLEEVNSYLELLRIQDTSK